MAKKPPETKTPETNPSAPQEVPPVAPDAVTEVQAPVMPPRDLEDENTRLRNELEASRRELQRVDEDAAAKIGELAEKNQTLREQLADEQTKVAILMDTTKKSKQAPQDEPEPLAEVVQIDREDPRHLRRICGF